MANVSPGPAFKVTNAADLYERMAREAACKFNPPSATASLDPDTFGHIAPEEEPSKLNISQINRPLDIRKTSSLHVACVCGRPLCGLEEEWIFDPMGCALHILGVCLTCGVQKVMYVSEPKVVPTSQTELRLERLRADVARVLEQIAALESDDNEPTATAADDEEAA